MLKELPMGVVGGYLGSSINYKSTLRLDEMKVLVSSGDSRHFIALVGTPRDKTDRGRGLAHTGTGSCHFGRSRSRVMTGTIG